jgi:hypothetical protein
LVEIVENRKMKLFKNFVEIVENKNLKLFKSEMLKFGQISEILVRNHEF